MGKVIIMVKNIRAMSDDDLFSRFKHIVRAQAVLEYLGKKVEVALSLEVRLAGEEIKKRMADRDLHVVKIKQD